MRPTLLLLCVSFIVSSPYDRVAIGEPASETRRLIAIERDGVLIHWTSGSVDTLQANRLMDFVGIRWRLGLGSPRLS